MAAESEEQPQGTKRPHDDSDSDSEDDMGPALPSAASAKKKRKRLPYERQYVAALPSATRYSKSLMHKEQLSFCTFTPHTDFLITSSIDGYVKFWKKTHGGIEFVKEFKAHEGEIKSVTCSVDGRNYATAGVDNTVKIFDVSTFDLLALLEPEEPPKCIAYVHGPGSSYPILAVSHEDSGKISLYDGRGENPKPMHTLSIHRAPVHLISYNPVYDCCISADESGMLEYWQPSSPYTKPSSVFEMKSNTSLFEFKKSKSIPVCLNISPTGHQFVTFSFPDRKIRLFDFPTAKLLRTYDESIGTITEMQQAGTLCTPPLDAIEFGRRIAVERELENPAVRKRINIQFDESGNFILYGSILGTKVLNTTTNSMSKLYGREESFRPLHLALYQGAPDKKNVVTVQMAASENPLLAEAESRDAMLVTTGSGKVRFYMFTNEDNISKSDRDIHNEKPRTLGGGAKTAAEEAKEERKGTSAVLHTSLGDIHIRLFPSLAPKAVENFTVHSRNGYYNNLIFHRVIRKFMIQTGDPMGDGTGGESIWGKEFEDEFSPELRHDKPYMVSMANAGPKTNASQFFITTEKAPWLDDKHTVFGRVVRGMEVVHAIENTKVWKEKPVEDVRIVDISVK